MKIGFNNSLPVVLSLVQACQATAQTFTTLHSFGEFSGRYQYANSDGAWPTAELITNSSGNTLYATTTAGGSSGSGTVFAVNTDGTGFTNLHDFTALSPPNTGPRTNSDGAEPGGGLVLSGNALYGTARSGGSSANGMVFKVNTDGTGFVPLHAFATTSTNFSGAYTNSDGSQPFAGLVLSGNTLYGTAHYGGSSGGGTLFAVNTDGTGFNVLHSFNGSDGANPYASLILLGNKLYGTTEGGGITGNGTVFAVNTNGTGFTVLHNFTAALPNGGGSITNSDGSQPYAGLILSGNALYGTALYGGTASGGSVFALNTDGTGFTNLHTFYYSENPLAGVILSGNTLYGTAANGGIGHGSVFSIAFTPQLTIVLSGANVVLSWPTNYAGFDYTGYRLQSTTTLDSPIWKTNLQSSVVVNGQSTVTSPILGTQQFFRLSQ